MCKMIICLFSLVMCFFPITSNVRAQADNTQEWTGTDEQKLRGLMTVWAEIRYASPHIEKMKEINWDNTVQKFIPKVLATKDIESYYKMLMEFASLLEDSHTLVIPPWGYMDPSFDNPPVEIVVIEDRYYIARTGNSDEIVKQRIYAGQELLTIGDDRPVRQYFEDHVLRYYTRGSKQGNEAVLVFYLMFGPRDEPIEFTVRDLDGSERHVVLTRKSQLQNGERFTYRFIECLQESTIETRMLADGILYVNIPNFQKENTRISTDFCNLIDSLDMSKVKGMILDVRYNMGGSGNISGQIVGCLIDEPVSSPINHYFHYTPADIPWGKQAVTWTSRQWEIKPRGARRYNGPVVVLIGPATHSAGEDFVIELMQTSHVITVGRSTSGGAGGSLSFDLPAGGHLSIGTFKATYPDGREYMGTGIQPDIEVHPTLTDIINSNDRVLNKGIEVIKNWKTLYAKYIGIQ